ncbi:substrate-binding periplasmic protein [Pseudomonas sp. EL_65y_Pfl2_R95]|uniref:substrate-binding periplasmic protein n=1 Tax=Pseudomonas sp. EL_65y_Pfl2_R95 TaxID=3088698 RepID=UPI0030DB2733
MLDRHLLKSWVLAISCMSACSLTFAEGSCERLVATGNPNNPPFMWRDPQNPKQLMGAQADMLQKVAKDLGLQLDVLYSRSWEKAEDEVRSGRIDLLAGAELKPAALDDMDYIYPSVYSHDSVVWVRNILSFPYIEWADLRERKGAKAADILSPAFTGYAKANLNIEQAANLSQAFQKLMLGEVDYVLAERESGLARATTMGLQDDLLPLSPPIEGQPMYLALSHNSACNDAWLRGQLAKKMTELTASELPASLLQKNLQRWKQQQPQLESVSAPKS